MNELFLIENATMSGITKTPQYFEHHCFNYQEIIFFLEDGTEDKNLFIVVDETSKDSAYDPILKRYISDVLAMESYNYSKDAENKYLYNNIPIRILRYEDNVVAFTSTSGDNASWIYVEGKYEIHTLDDIKKDFVLCLLKKERKNRISLFETRYETDVKIGNCTRKIKKLRNYSKDLERNK